MIDARDFGRLEGEVKALRDDFKEHKEFEKTEHAGINTNFSALHAKVDNLNNWKDKVILGSLFAAVVVVLLLEPSTELARRLIHLALG